MKQTATKIVWAIVMIVLFSCAKGKSSSGSTTPPEKAYTISGIIKDASGNPVPGARIRVENPTGDNIHFTARTNEAGRYSVTVSAIGGYKIYAWKEVELNNEVYQVRLGMEKDADYDAFSVPASGVVKNFTWKLSGRIPDRTISRENGTGYFGGTIKFINYNSLADEMPAGTQVTIQLTPTTGARYLDGSTAAGKIVEKKFTIAAGVGQAYYINDIPATHYKITASATLNGNSKNVNIGSGTPDVFHNSAEHYFKSEGGSGSFENGLGSPNEYSFYVMFAR
ncbi:carboxypeptidase-like regulatory domain-containing protein [Terrimonas rubra]|uniref:Carboxypeptidase-like regulatory domain-containing protein n=1 Tax=Terrimonas rubra TaxID=1035890 RepID=A0ABW6A891_9BACT